jgi:hypothetical protein
MDYSAISFLLAGALGALIKDIIQDNSIALPNIKDHTLQLGILGGIAIGAMAGYLIDGQFSTAFLAGYTGASVIEGLVVKHNKKEEESAPTIEEVIKKIAKEELVDPDLAIKVAECESKLDSKAIHINKDGSMDRGLYQINSKYHPEVSDEQAFNPEYATRFFCKAFKEGHLSWWNATKECWSK